MTTRRLEAYRTGVCLLAGLLSAAHAAAQALPYYEMPLRYLGEFPANEETGCANDIQGITQDGAFWYITQTDLLWKIPLTRSLTDLPDWPFNDPTLPVTTLSKYINEKPYVHPDFNHMGDLEYRSVCGQGLVFI